MTVIWKPTPDFFSMALAFECQVLPGIPQEEYDIRPRVLVTEMRIETRYMEGEKEE